MNTSKPILFKTYEDLENGLNEEKLFEGYYLKLKDYQLLFKENSDLTDGIIAKPLNLKDLDFPLIVYQENQDFKIIKSYEFGIESNIEIIESSIDWKPNFKKDPKSNDAFDSIVMLSLLSFFLIVFYYNLNSNSNSNSKIATEKQIFSSFDNNAHKGYSEVISKNYNYDISKNKISKEEAFLNKSIIILLEEYEKKTRQLIKEKTITYGDLNILKKEYVEKFSLLNNKYEAIETNKDFAKFKEEN